MTLKLSRRAVALRQAEEAIDRHFARLIAAEIGPMGALHARKRAQAEAGSGALLDGDRDVILARAAEQDERLAALDRDRRAMKAQVRAAGSSDEIRNITSRL